MAQIEVKVPQLSESVAEATLLSWHKKVGEAVSRDENMIDIETDKVVLELPAPSAGVITQLIKADGATVVSGEVIAIIDTEASAQVSPLQVSAVPSAAPNAPIQQAAAAPAADQSKAGVAMPAAAKLMAEHELFREDYSPEDYAAVIAWLTKLRAQIDITIEALQDDAPGGGGE